ncbi:MAG: hypothetical protein KGI33_01235 [Thaumarchaeota archaeon]|nr:hypothetical protein [Nitrososphaerota archaeon]
MKPLKTKPTRKTYAGPGQRYPESAGRIRSNYWKISSTLHKSESKRYRPRRAAIDVHQEAYAPMIQNNGSQAASPAMVYGTRKNYGKATDLLAAVRELMVRRMEDEQRVTELQQRGFKISVRTLRRIKAWIRTTPQQRLDYIAHTEFVQFHLEAIDTMKYVNKKCLELVETGDPRLVLRASEAVRENMKALANIYDANPIVRAIAEKLGDKIVLQEPAASN